MFIFGQPSIKCCNNCEQRKPKCHSTCEMYQNEKKNHEARKAEIQKKRWQENDFEEWAYKSIQSSKRRRH